ncbi:MAG: beta-galactosidase, partial [Bacteroidaceae bacterium]|nr:beta-galactosidase [Bacteroidaceae bacterium]
MVANEYGSYGEDKVYVGKIRDIVKESGFDKVALFQCDWSSNFTKNGLDDLVWTMNFGTGANIDQQFRRLGELRPESPQMCSEFWSGWFDKWGARHETRPAKAMVEGIDEMLSKGISFSLYMTHGGTSFGHWAGANSPGFAPDVTSYDYDAPINEYGKATEKYYLLRETLQKYSNKKLPSVPKAPMPIITVPKFELKEFSSIFNGTDSKFKLPIRKEGGLMTFEEMDMGWGSMLYTTTMPEIPAQSVITADFHDFAQVFINGKYIGKIDRVKNEKSLTLPPVKKGDELEIFVEAMGRINFGRAIKDFKGIVGEVTITAEVEGIVTTWKPQSWVKFGLPDSYEKAADAFVHNNDYTKAENEGQRLGKKPQWNVDGLDLVSKRGYYRGYFNLKKVGDTFLNFETWGKGLVYVNGHAMGRIWEIGPQQTLYMPGCWLKKGENEIIVFDIAGPREAVCEGLEKPVIDMLQLQKPKTHREEGENLDLSGYV